MFLFFLFLLIFNYRNLIANFYMLPEGTTLKKKPLNVGTLLYVTRRHYLEKNPLNVGTLKSRKLN